MSWYEPIPAVSLELVEALGVSPEAAVIDVGGGGSFLADELVGPRLHRHHGARHLGSGSRCDVRTGLRCARAVRPSGSPQMGAGSAVRAVARPRRPSLPRRRARCRSLHRNPERRTRARRTRDRRDLRQRRRDVFGLTGAALRCGGPGGSTRKGLRTRRGAARGARHAPRGTPQPFTWVAARRWAGNAAFAVPHRLTLPVALADSGVRLVRDGRLLLDTGTVAQGDLVDRVAPVGAVLVLPRADLGDDDAGPVPAPTIVCLASGGQCTKSHCRSGRSSPSMIKERIAGDDEEVLLVGLPVIHRHRLSRLRTWTLIPTWEKF